MPQAFRDNQRPISPFKDVRRITNALFLLSVLSYPWYAIALNKSCSVQKDYNETNLQCGLGLMTFTDVFFSRIITIFILVAKVTDILKFSVGQGISGATAAVNRLRREHRSLKNSRWDIYRLFNVNKKKWTPEGRFPNQGKMAKQRNRERKWSN